MTRLPSSQIRPACPSGQAGRGTPGVSGRPLVPTVTACLTPRASSSVTRTRDPHYPTAIAQADRLAEICAQYLGKGQLVAVEGRIQTRQWEDDKKTRHWKTEIVANPLIG